MWNIGKHMSKIKETLPNPSKKLPIEASDRFLKHIKYRYGVSPRLMLEPVGKKKKPSLEKDVVYWVPETYRLVTVNNKTIQYFSDGYTSEKPKWIEASKMKKGYARYAFECVGIDKKKLKNLGKTEVMNTGVFAERIPQPEDALVTDDFKKKPIEIWRFANAWDKTHEEGERWEDNPEVFLYGVVVHRLVPEYSNYRDHNWSG